jgi:hypothetical protein
MAVIRHALAALLFVLFGASTASADAGKIDFKTVFADQQRQITRAISDIVPGKPGITEVFYVALAGEAEEAVFMREAFATAEIMADRFGTRARTSVLINHAATYDAVPLATINNLKAILAGVAARMNTDEDVLVLFMTSHGFRGSFSLSFNPTRIIDLKPHHVKKALDESGIKHQVVIISACFSGSFIPKLKADNRLIITAARADRSSFGCSNENEWTYFGNAFFNQALRKTRSFTDAFKDAKETVLAWEKRDKLEPPSEPQMVIGAGIADKLKEIARD